MRTKAYDCQTQLLCTRQRAYKKTVAMPACSRGYELIYKSTPFLCGFTIRCGLKQIIVLAGSFNTDLHESARIQCDEPGAITHVNNGSKAVKYHFYIQMGKGMFK